MRLTAFRDVDVADGPMYVYTYKYMCVCGYLSNVSIAFRDVDVADCSVCVCIRICVYVCAHVECD